MLVVVLVLVVLVLVYYLMSTALKLEHTAQFSLQTCHNTRLTIQNTRNATHGTATQYYQTNLHQTTVQGILMRFPFDLTLYP